MVIYGIIVVNFLKNFVNKIDRFSKSENLLIWKIVFFVGFRTLPIF